MKRALALFGMAAMSAAAAPPPPPLHTAKAYVESIYRAVPTPMFDYNALRYTPELGSWLRRDAQYSRRADDVGALDWVPFCGCQDNDSNYALVGSEVARKGPTGAIVTVLLRNGPQQRYRIDLAWTAGAWRIADVHGPDHPSLLAFLRREVPKLEATLPPQRH